jgi:hypothetical protein
MTSQLIWTTPEWNGEKEVELKSGKKSKRKRRIHCPEAVFETRREAVDWCNRHGIPARLIKMQTVTR